MNSATPSITARPASWWALRSGLTALLLLAVALVPAGSACAATQVYDIDINTTSGWSSSGCCGGPNYRVAAGNGSTLTATYTDTLPAGSIQDVTIEVAIEHGCFANSVDVFFNGEAAGTWGSGEASDCNCGDPAQAVVAFTLTPPAGYNFGGVNTVTMVNTLSGSCHQAIAGHPAWSPTTAIRVTANSLDVDAPALTWGGKLSLIFLLMLMIGVLPAILSKLR